MSDKPIKFPRWADSPPAGPPTTITEPTAAQKDSGWQPFGSAEFPNGKPVRQIANWLINLIYQWVTWFDQISQRTSDMHPDHALPGGTAPTIAAGLGPVAAGDFSAVVYVDGYRIGPDPIDSPAHTYTATTDTYWDLGRDGVWTPVEVPATDPAPAVTANSVRVYAVRTDATDRTALILDTREEYLNIDKGLEFVWGDESDAAKALPLWLFKFLGDGSVRYSLIAEWRKTTGSLFSHRLYIDDETSTIWFVTGGAWNDATSMWDPDPGVFLMEFWRWNTDGMNVLAVDGLSGPQPDSIITSNPGAFPLSAVHRWITPSTIRAGSSTEVINAEEGFAYEVPNAGAGAYVHRGMADYDKLKIFGLDKITAGQGTDAAEGLGGFLISNAEWNNSTQQWDQETAGFDSYKLVLDKDGFRLLTHRNADGASWDDVVGATQWRVVETMSHTRTKILSLPGSDAQVHSGIPQSVVISLGPSGSQDDPVDNAFEVGELRAISVGANKSAVWPVKLPQGALVSGVEVEGAFDTPGAEQIRMALVRLNGLTNSRTSFRNGTAYDVFTGAGLGVRTTKVLTIDNTEAIRTIDNGTYSYYFWVGEQAGDTNHLWVISRIKITYTMT